MAADDKKAARAEAKAEKAREKAMRPWYKKKRFVISLGAVAVVVIAVAASGGGGDGTDDVAAESEQAEGQEEGGAGDGASGGDEAEQVGMNESVRDGKFEFTVTSFDCGVDQVGEEPVVEEAQGQYCLLGLTVENIGDEAQSLFADNQMLIDDQGREFSADSVATITHNPQGDAFFSEINPGNSIEGEVVFDVSEGARVVESELHDSAFSDGVVVTLE